LGARHYARSTVIVWATVGAGVTAKGTAIAGINQQLVTCNRSSQYYVYTQQKDILKLL